jgi:hypothetical protein
VSTVSVVATVEPSGAAGGLGTGAFGTVPFGEGPYRTVPSAGYPPPRIRLDVTDTGDPAITTVTVTRLDPDGRIAPVRTLDGGPLTLSTSGADRVGLLYDYEAPLGQPVSYSTLETPGSTSAQVTLDEPWVWLIHPGVPERSLPVWVAGMPERTRRVTRGVHYPMGRARPVVQTDGQRKAAEYALTIMTRTDVERAAIDDLIDDAGVVLLNVPATLGWGVGAEYVAVGDTTEARLYRWGPEQRRTWTLPLIVVDRPEGGTQSERVYVDVLAAYASYAQVQAAYPSYADLLAGP